MKLNIKKGDQVVILTGDDKGKKGRVNEVLREKNRVIVETFFCDRRDINIHSYN